MKISTKNILIIAISVLLAMIAAIIAVFIIYKDSKNKIQSLNNSCYSSSETDNSSSEIPLLSSEAVPEVTDNGIKLVITSPTSTKINTTDEILTFTGSSDPTQPLTMNGNTVERTEQGLFSFQVTLNVGKNTFSFVHKGDTVTYTANYRYVVINGYDPSTAKVCQSGSTIVVNVSARAGSNVTATLNNNTITLKSNITSQNSDDGSGSGSDSSFTIFSGMFSLPKDNINDISLGRITYTATYNGKSETFRSGNITCKKADIVVEYDPNATPASGNYINVGSGYIAEIVEYNAETFDGDATDSRTIDMSRPTNNYLPKGTVDYCSTSTIDTKIGSLDVSYVTLRCGRRVYLNHTDKPNKGKKPVVNRYEGKLPDHNEICLTSLDQTGRHTVLKLKPSWKAPFYFDILPQQYTNPATQDYRISNATYNYIDITFCYATVFNGEITIPEDNPLFSSAKIVKNDYDYTLRLYLKKQGAFYGWDSYYDESGNLCFEFLNPAKTLNDSNEYGINLNGAKILIDVGHGGPDGGAPGFDTANNEAVRNLFLAYKLKAELESIGANVTMTRTDNTLSSSDDKITMMKRVKPDYCICIHHDSSSGNSPSRFSAFYYAPYSQKAVEFVYNNTVSTGIYNDYKIAWHYYFMGRSTNCPVVLTENGFISNLYDYNNIINESVNIKKAKALTKGIADYFKSIQ